MSGSTATEGTGNMGYLLNHAMVVSSTDVDQAKRAQGVAKYIFGRVDMAGLVSDVLPHAINGGGAFFVSPDGSKEGWSDSDKAAEARQELIAFLQAEYYFDWAELKLGGDDSQYEITASPQRED